MKSGEALIISNTGEGSWEEMGLVWALMEERISLSGLEKDHSRHKTVPSTASQGRWWMETGLSQFYTMSANLSWISLAPLSAQELRYYSCNMASRGNEMEACKPWKLEQERKLRELGIVLFGGRTIKVT